MAGFISSSIHAFRNRPSGSTRWQTLTASEIYSLGAALWALLAGQSPCETIGNGPAVLRTIAEGRLPWNHPKDVTIPESLQRICRKCTAHNPQDRFSSAAELADALSAWLNRPRWNRHFPKLRFLSQAMVAPALLLSSLVT